jgi:hypothetical protein
VKATKKPSKVFVYYSRHDEEIVKPLAGLLGAAADAVFLDITSLKPGDLWREEIEGAVRDATVFILCWCCESEQSAFVAHEIGIALEDTTKRLIPVLFCSTPLPKPLSDRQWIDLRGRIIHVWNGSEHLVEITVTVAVTTPALRPTRAPTRRPRGTLVLLGLAFLAFFVIFTAVVPGRAALWKVSVGLAPLIVLLYLAVKAVGFLLKDFPSETKSPYELPEVQVTYTPSQDDEIAQIAIEYFSKLGK